MPTADLLDATSPPTPLAGVERIAQRWPAARPFVVVGVSSVVVGGFVAAVAGPTGFELGSWVAAYLVLVAGVAQVALGAGQAWLAECRPPATTRRAELATWNVGVVCTLAGSVASAPLLSTVGAVATVVALVLFARAVATGRPPDRRRGRTSIAYVCLVVALAISTPVGLVLAWVRHG